MVARRGADRGDGASAAGSRASLKDVARAAGVGVGTASRTFTGNGYVGEETRQRVLRVAEELGYRPNRLAAGLRSDTSHLVALVLPDLTNEFYAVSSQIIHARLRDAGYQLLVASAGTVEDEKKTLESLIDYRVDGIIHVPAASGSRFRAPCPIVELNRRSHSPGIASVTCDDAAGFRELTRSLLDRGYRDLALIVGDEGLSTTQERIAGFRDALGAREGTAHSEDTVHSGGAVYSRVLPGSYSADWGHRACLELLGATDWQPSVIVAASPRIATGVALALTQRGIVPPRDIGFASYSSPDWFSFWGGGVQTFLPPLDQMARRATDMLLGQLSDPTTLPSSVVLSGELRPGGSVRSIG
ncbi:MAG: LacI family transcriptional regulator [Propionibacterium sp.]|nr:LacI family transcriptional regulator [Propionibacterium sp.]